MAKAKQEGKKSLAETLAALDKKFAQPESDTFFISTDSIELDWALGGGVASKRITEYMAWQGSGKTTICLHMVKNFQRNSRIEGNPVFGKKALYIDSEHALDRKYATSIGVDWDDMIIRQPNNGEEGFTYLYDLVDTDEVGLVIVDSVSGMVPQSQMEGDAGKSNMGRHAMMMSAELPKVQVKISNANTVCVFVSQLREKIGVMFGNPETTPGGNALKFFASNRVRLGQGTEKSDGEVIALKPSFKTLKCKTASPYRKGEIFIEFGKGIDRWKEIMKLGKKYKVLFERGGIVGFEEERIPVEEFRQHVETYSPTFTAVRKAIFDKLDQDSENIGTPEAEG